MKPSKQEKNPTTVNYPGKSHEKPQVFSAPLPNDPHNPWHFPWAPSFVVFHRSRRWFASSFGALGRGGDGSFAAAFRLFSKMPLATSKEIEVTLYNTKPTKGRVLETYMVSQWMTLRLELASPILHTCNYQNCTWKQKRTHVSCLSILHIFPLFLKFLSPTNGPFRFLSKTLLAGIFLPATVAVPGWRRAAVWKAGVSQGVWFKATRAPFV